MVPIKDLNVDDEDLFENLLNVWTKLGRQPREREMQKPLSKYSSKPYKNRFEGWINSLKAFKAYVEATRGEEVVEKGSPTADSLCLGGIGQLVLDCGSMYSSETIIDVAFVVPLECSLKQTTFSPG